MSKWRSLIVFKIYMWFISRYQYEYELWTSQISLGIMNEFVIAVHFAITSFLNYKVFLNFKKF